MEIAVALITILAKYGPAVYEKAVEIAHKRDPKPEDFDALLAVLKAHPTGESYFAPKVP